MIWLCIFIFIGSCILLYFSSEWIINGLIRIAKFLGWREFVVAFFIMAFATSLTNLFVGISSALHKIPQLSFGDVVGGNLVDLTLAIALAVLFISTKKLPTKSRLVQTSSIFTAVVAILPLLLILDGTLGGGDGLILIMIFLFYTFWLFSKKERFTRIYENSEMPILREFGVFIQDLGKILLGIIILITAAQGIVLSSKFFAQYFNLEITLIGILIVGLGNALPEIYFAIASARKGETWMILGNLMGAVIVPSTLVLGIVALIHPIEIVDSTPFAIARIFLIASVMFFLFFIRTGRQITKREALFLLGIYIAFVLTIIITH